MAQIIMSAPIKTRVVMTETAKMLRMLKINAAKNHEEFSMIILLFIKNAPTAYKEHILFYDLSNLLFDNCANNI